MSFRSSLSWLGTAQALSFALQFGSSVVFARYLTPYEMGVFAVATALVGLLSIIQQVGLPALIVREPVITEEFTATAFTVNAALSVLLSLAIVAASSLGAAALRDPGVGTVLLVLAVTPLFSIISFLPMANLERDGDFKSIAFVSAIAAIVTAVCGIGLVVSGFGFLSIAYAQVLGSFVMMLLGTYAGRRYHQYRIGLQSWRPVLGFSVQMLAISGIHGVVQRLSDLLLGRLLGLSALGIYNRAAGMNSMLWNNVNLVVGRVVLVDYADTLRQSIPLRERYLRTVSIMTAVLWPAFAGLAVIATPFVKLVYGDRWLPAVGPFILLALTSILLSSITMTWELFTVTGRLREQTRLEAIRAVIGMVLFGLGCVISIEAAAAMRLVEAAFAIVLYRPYLNSMTGTTGRDFWRVYLSSGALTLLAILPAGILVHAGSDLLSTAAIIMCSLGLGAIFWLIGLLVLNHTLLNELRSLRVHVARRLATIGESEQHS